MSCYNCKESKQEPTLAERLNKRVTILQQTAETDEYNQPLDVWDEVVTVWAAVEPLQGKEFFAAMAEHAEVTTRIRVRYRTGIDRTMIVRYKDLEFEILYIINPKLANVELQLMCRERQ